MIDSHGLIEAAGAGVLIVAGIAAVFLAYRAQPIEVPVAGRVLPSAGRIGWLMLAAASIGAAIIHAAVAPEHLEEWGAAGSIFLVCAAIQAAWAVAAIARPTMRTFGIGVAVAGIAINGVVLGIWALSRTVGFPPGNIEAVGRPDTASGLLEGVIVIALIGTMLPGRPIARLRSVLADWTSIAWVPAVGMIVVTTILGLASGDPHMHH